MSYALKSRSRTPKGGWIFRQPEANWEMPIPLAQTFDAAVGQIRRMRMNNRKLNLNTDPDAIGEELEQFTVARINFDPEWCVEVGEEAKKKALSSSPGRGLSLWQRARAGVAALVVAIRRTSDGARILDDWLGAGGLPADPALAESRSVVCEPCPNNVKGDWKALVTGAVAEAVLEQRRVKTQLNITVSNEDNLGTCAVCLCHLALKVHVPMAHIQKYTSDAIWSELPEFCWMKKERK